MVTDAKTLLIEQYKKRPNFVKLVDAFATSLHEVSNECQKLLTERTLDTAVGAQLDVLGKILGLPRPYLDPPASEIFTFEGDSGSEGAGFSGIGRGDVGGYFIGLEPINDTLLDDETYRLFLRAKVIYNNTTATIDEMIRFIEFVFNTDASIVNGVGFIDLSLGRAISQREYDFIFSVFPIAAGVRIREVTYATGAGAFGFAGHSGNEGFSGLGVGEEGEGSGFVGVFIGA